MKKILLVLLCMLIIAPCTFMLSACGTPAVYSIYVKTSDVEYGSVTGQGDYSEGTNITLRATPMKEASFLCWTLNNKVVSADAEYTFTVNNDTKGTYVALFDQRLDYYTLTEVALTFKDGVQIQELTLDLKVGSSLSSLQTAYNVTTNPVVLTQNSSSVTGFHNGYLIHKKTTDENFYCRLTANASYEGEGRDFSEGFELDFTSLYNNGIYETDERVLSGYGTIKLTFEKINKEIVNQILGISTEA